MFHADFKAVPACRTYTSYLYISGGIRLADLPYPAVLTAEGHGILLSFMVALVDQPALVFLFDDLAACFLKGGFHLILFLHMLELQEQAAISGRIHDNQVASPVAGLLLGNNTITQAGEEAVQDQVVAVFMIFMIEGQGRFQDLIESFLRPP